MLKVQIKLSLKVKENITIIILFDKYVDKDDGIK